MPWVVVRIATRKVDRQSHTGTRRAVGFYCHLNWSTKPRRARRHSRACMSSTSLISLPRTPVKAIVSALPSTPAMFSLAAVKPRLAHHTAMVRLKTNGPLLAIYLWIWLMPKWYKVIKRPLFFIASLGGLDEHLVWVFFAVGEHCCPLTQRIFSRADEPPTELIVGTLLSWNTYEAVYSLKHPEVPSTSPGMISRVGTPVAMSPAQRRLKGAPKVCIHTSMLKQLLTRSTVHSPDTYPLSIACQNTKPPASCIFYPGKIDDLFCWILDYPNFAQQVFLCLSAQFVHLFQSQFFLLGRDKPKSISYVLSSSGSS